MFATYLSVRPESLFGSLLFVLGHVAVLLHFLGLFIGVATNVSHGDLAFFGKLFSLLGKLLAALLSRLRESKTNDHCRRSAD